MTDEIWKPISGFEGYFISNKGRVKSMRRNRELILKQYISSWSPYKFVTLTKDWKTNKRKTRYIHKLVLTAFVQERPDGMECCHKDGNPLNNNLDNLRWDTHHNNCMDKVANGTGKLTNSDAARIHQLKKEGWVQNDIAELYNVSKGNVSSILNGRIFKDVYRLVSGSDVKL